MLECEIIYIYIYIYLYLFILLRKISFSCRNSQPRFSSPKPSHCTDNAIPARSLYTKRSLINQA